ncbi:ABC transporter permease subunit [Streptomyces sp. SID3343]|uniref:ABC transporter permease subunit n=1 Tax=Streptomyces sp. SID3343 TaxID=2690260 RepID=UPI001371C176|nr:ABC transporter permease subunit [Streptomyces sp. SID3343]MYW02549.1 ABC transporter permease subunit [Streptomyces sp. SID3343]
MSTTYPGSVPGSGPTPGSAPGSVPVFESRAAGRGAVTFPRVLDAEWIKLRSLRSTFYTLLAAIVFLIGFGLVLCAVMAHSWPTMSEANRADFSPPNGALSGFFVGQLAIGALGVLVVTGEYATGSIRATMSAVPHRLPVLWAKALVFAVVTFVSTGIAAVIAFLGGQALLADRHVGVSLGDAGVPRVVVGVPLYLTLVAVLAIGLGTVIRSTAGGISAVVGLLLVLPALAQVMPRSWQNNGTKFLPSEAGQSFLRWHHAEHTLTPGTGLAVFALYAFASLAVAAVLLRRRDT